MKGTKKVICLEVVIFGGEEGLWLMWWGVGLCEVGTFGLTPEQ